MKPVQFKDAIRNIWKQKVAYLSIIVIAMLATTAYLGINFASTGLYNNASRYYERLNYRDFEVASTMLLTADDIAAIGALDGVRDVEGVLQAEGKIALPESRKNVTILSLTERISKAELLEGRFPAAMDECVVEDGLMEALGLRVGDRIAIEDALGAVPALLKGGEFTITGRVLHADHYAEMRYAVGNRYVLVDKSAFDTGSIGDVYMKALVEIVKPEGLNVFDQDYYDLLPGIEAQINALAEIRTPTRETEIRSAYQSELDVGRAELEAAETKLRESRALLGAKAEELAQSEQQLEDARIQLLLSETQLDMVESQLNTAKPKLDSAVRELDEARAELEAGEAKLQQGLEELIAAEAKLEKGRRELETAEEQLWEGAKKLTATYAEIEAGRADIRDQIKDAVNAASTLTPFVNPDALNQIVWAERDTDFDIDDPGLTAATFHIADELPLTVNLYDSIDAIIGDVADYLVSIGAITPDQRDTSVAIIKNTGAYNQASNKLVSVQQDLRLWDDAHDTYLDGQRQFQSSLSSYQSGLGEYQRGQIEYHRGLVEYEQGQKQYQSGLEQYEQSRAEYRDGKEKYDEGKAAYIQGALDYEDGLIRFADGQEQLADGERQYAEGLAEYEAGIAELKAAEEALSTQSPCYWVVLDPQANVSYAHAMYSASNIGKIGMTFALLFVLMGALVIYVTVGRIVDEQRRLVGTEKALGFFNKEILAKYLFFGLTATLLGMLLGTAIGYTAIQNAILTAHDDFYVTDSMLSAFRPGLTLLVGLAGTALSTLAVWIACARLMRDTARDLLQEKMPEAKRRPSWGGNAGSLYTRLIFRNMRADLKRVLITTASVAGCCALLTIGFHLKSGVQGALDRQYGEIIRYEQRLNFDPAASPTAREDFENILAGAGVSFVPAAIDLMSFRAGDRMDAVELISADAGAVNTQLALRDRESGEPLYLPSYGVVIYDRMAKSLGLGIGDTFTIYDTDMNPHDAVVSGIYEYFFGYSILASPEAYLEIFGQEPEVNAFWFSGAADIAALETQLSGVTGYDELIHTAATQQDYQRVASVLNLVTLVLIVAAALMAYFVLLNLANMYVNQKKRELTIMRVNGFTTREVIRYVSMETWVTTIAGILLGLGVGLILGEMIISTVEQPRTGFFHGVSPFTLLIAAAITGVFSALINMIALRKVKFLKLSDIA